jgi:hypothetical protein
MSMIVEVDMTDHTVSEKQIQRIRDNLEEIQENAENPSRWAGCGAVFGSVCFVCVISVFLQGEGGH